MNLEYPARNSIRRFTVVAIVMTILTIGAMVLFTGGAAAEPITDCGEINQSGSYVAQENLTNPSSFTCLPITADDVDVDLNGHAIPIVVTPPVTNGISVNGTNVSIRNGTVIGQVEGVQISSDSSDISLENLTVTDNVEGISTQGNNVTLNAVTVTRNSNGVTVQSGDRITIGDSNLDGNNPSGSTGTHLSVADASNVTVESTSLDFAGTGDRGIGLNVADTESVSLRDLSLTGNEDAIRLHRVDNISLENVETVFTFGDQFNASDVTDITATNLGVSDHSFSFDHVVSDVVINTVVPTPPSGLVRTGNLGFVITGLYPSQSLVVEETISGPSFHPQTAQYYRYNESWELIEYSRSFTTPTEVQFTATITENGPHAILGSRTVDSLQLETSSVMLGESASLIASAIYADGTVVDATNSTIFLSETPDIISITDSTVTGEDVGTGIAFLLYEDPYTGLDWNGSESITVTDDPDPLPEGYYGSVAINGTPAPAGTVIEARIDGEPLGSIIMESQGQYGGPTAFDQQLIVNGTAADSGETVAFHIEPNSTEFLPGLANETATFTPDGLTELNLTATLEEPIPPVYETTVVNDGTPKAVGLPAPVNGTLGDMFDDISGINTIYGHTGDGWVQIWEQDHEFEAMEAFALTTSGEGPATITITLSFETNTPAPNRTLEEGWSFVAAPAFTDAEDAFGTDETLLVVDAFGRPSGAQFGTGDSFDSYIVGSPDWGATAPTVSPFGGYYVYADSPTELPVRAQEFNHGQALNAMLGIN